MSIKLFVRLFVSFDYVNDAHHVENYDLSNMTLFLVCRKIYEEVVSIFYQENVFLFILSDVLLCVLNEHSQLREHLKYMHKIDLV